MTADKDRIRAYSREAARTRRRAESEVFSDLSRLLPLSHSLRSHLDKPSIIRLAISYLRTRALLAGNAGPSREWEDGRTEGSRERAVAGEMELYLGCLEGFVMVLSSSGDIVYLTQNVLHHTGLSQVELMGHSVYEFTHPCDHEEIRSSLCPPAAVGSRGRGGRRDFLVRMKSTLTQRGRTTNLKAATWKVLHCRGRVKVCGSPCSLPCLLVTCQPLPLHHTLSHTHSFTSQHNMDMKFTHCDQRITALLGYSPEELLGHSVYELCHILDINCLAKSHTNLCSKLHSVSGLYRLLVKGGGFVWVESHSAVAPCSGSSKASARCHQPRCVLCVTYVLSGVEEPTLQLSVDQTAYRYVS